MVKYYDEQVYRNLTALLQECIDHKVKHPMDFSCVAPKGDEYESGIDGHMVHEDYYIGTEQACSNSPKIVVSFDVESPTKALECLAADGGELLSIHCGYHAIGAECYDVEQAATLSLAIFKKVWNVAEIPELEVSTLNFEEDGLSCYDIDLQVAKSAIRFAKITAKVKEFNALAKANGYNTLSFSEETGMLTGSWDPSRKPKGLFAKGRKTYKELHKQLMAITDLAVQ